MTVNTECKIKTLEEQCKKMSEALQDFNSRMDKTDRRVEQIEEKLEQKFSNIEEMWKSVQAMLSKDEDSVAKINTGKRNVLREASSGSNPVLHHSEEIGENFLHNYNTGNNSGFNFSMPKVELQSFGGQDPRSWIRKCATCFRLNRIPQNRWVEIASMFLEGRAAKWLDGFLMKCTSRDWGEFTVELCRRFEGRSDIVEEFNKIAQEGSVDEYIEKFEDLRSLMMAANPYFSESYYISSFISGLKGEIKPMLRILKPPTLYEAFDQTKWQEEQMLEVRKMSNSMGVKTNSQNSTYASSSKFTSYLPPKSISAPTIPSAGQKSLTLTKPSINAQKTFPNKPGNLHPKFQNSVYELAFEVWLFQKSLSISIRANLGVVTHGVVA